MWWARRGRNRGPCRPRREPQVRSLAAWHRNIAMRHWGVEVSGAATTPGIGCADAGAHRRLTDGRSRWPDHRSREASVADGVAVSAKITWRILAHDVAKQCETLHVDDW